MYKKIIHANIYTPDEFLINHSIEIANGCITSIYPSTLDESFSEEVFNAKGNIVAPGLIDIHTHGCMGSDVMDADQKALNTISIFLGKHGVTSFLATTTTNSEENILNALETISKKDLKLNGAHLLGAHVEGPYINLIFKGAQNPDFLRLPAINEYIKWFDLNCVRLIAIAPELAGMDKFIQACVEHHIELAIGHSNASYEQVIHAANLGVRQATHLFNGMHGLHHREPGTAGGILSDERIFAQIIVDGIHIHPAVVKLIITCKGIDRTILISDSMRATGLNDGEYDLGGQEVLVNNGVARIANGSLAGSTLTLDNAIRNAMKFTGLDFQHILPMATRTPADALHLYPRKGCIRVGSDADLVLFDQDYQVIKTISGGELIFEEK